MENGKIKIPIWFWVVTIFYLLWNIMGVLSFFVHTFSDSYPERSEKVAIKHESLNRHRKITFLSFRRVGEMRNQNSLVYSRFIHPFEDALVVQYSLFVMSMTINNHFFSRQL